MKTPICFFLCLLLLVFPEKVSAQDELDLVAINQDRIQINKKAMFVLGGWSLANIGVSGVLRGQNEGPERYFHEMNVFWNLTNLAIAGISLIGVYKSDPTSFDKWETYNEQQKTEKGILFNAGLDLGYIATGAYLIELSNRPLKQSDRLKGYGQSMMLQGGFLLLFDLSSYYIRHKRAKKKLKPLIGNISVNSNGIGYSLLF